MQINAKDYKHMNRHTCTHTHTPVQVKTCLNKTLLFVDFPPTFLSYLCLDKQECLESLYYHMVQNGSLVNQTTHQSRELEGDTLAVGQDAFNIKN